MALNQDRIIEVAFEILDSHGLADLSMRRIATSLGVQASAIYHHVPSKQMLLAALTDRIIDGVDEPIGMGRPAMDAWATSLRDHLLAHRDSAELVATVRGFRLSQRDVTHHPTTVLAAAGLEPDNARAAAGTLLHFVVGHVAEEQAAEEWDRLGQPSPQPSPSTGESFELGLALILDGIAAQLDAARN